jgi:hypothetical protein
MKKLMIALAAVLAIGAFTHAFADSSHNTYGDGQNTIGPDTTGVVVGGANGDGGCCKNHGDAQNTGNQTPGGHAYGDSHN